MSNTDVSQILKELQEDKLKNDTIGKIIRHLNNELVIRYKKEYKKLFKILLDEKNYPVAILCSCPFNKSGVASSLILAALDVNLEDMAMDYRCDLESANFGLMLPSDKESISSLSLAQNKF